MGIVPAVITGEQKNEYFVNMYTHEMVVEERVWGEIQSWIFLSCRDSCLGLRLCDPGA